MAINTSIYGSADSWINCYYQQSTLTNKNQKANFGDSQTTLGQGVTKGKLSYTEGIDKSLSFCGLGTESALSHISFIGLSGGTVSLLSTQDRFQTNFAFFEKSNTTWYIPNANMDITAKDGFCWQSSTNSQNYVKNLEPMTRVNPQNMVLLVKVKAQTGVNGSTIDVTLKQYLDSYTVTHPNIIRVYIVAYYGNASTGRYTIADKGSPNNQIPFQLGLLDEYECEPKNLKFFMYSWYNNVVMGRYCDTTYYGNDYFELVACPDSAKEHIKFSRYNSDYVDVHIEYYAEFEQDVLKTVACFGLYFTPDSSILERGALTHNNMFIGLLDENGIGHGQYLRGADTVNAPQNNYSDMSQSGYDYTKEVDKSKYSNGTNFNLWDFQLNCINKFYVLTQAQVEQLSTELYTIMSNVSSDMPIERYNQTVFLTQNPIDCIVSIKRFPVDVPHLGTDTTLKLGSQSTGITTAHYLSKPCNVYYFEFSNSNDTGLYKTHGGSFLDFEPYTKVSINVPFCGSFDVPCNYFHKYGGVKVALLIDFVTGACTAFLLVRDNVVDSIQGECGVNVPLSGLQTATIDSQIFNASMSKQKQDNNFALSMLGGAAAIAVGVATGGAAAIAGGAAAVVGSVTNKVTNDKTLDYNVTHMQAPIKQVSSASPVIARANDMRCKMIISRPEFIEGYDETVYSETIGFACLLNGTVSDFSGLTVGNIDLSGINCSPEEKEMIKKAFASGVYL